VLHCLEERTVLQAVYTWGYLKVIELLQGFLCNCIYNQATLAFLAGSFMAGLGSQRVNVELNKDLII
jgi:hypothetical protein